MSYYDLGACSRPITTTSPDTQLWFDRGLNWVYGFNHAEAIKCLAFNGGDAVGDVSEVRNIAFHKGWASASM